MQKTNWFSTLFFSHNIFATINQLHWKLDSIPKEIKIGIVDQNWVIWISLELYRHLFDQCNTTSAILHQILFEQKYTTNPCSFTDKQMFWNFSVSYHASSFLFLWTFSQVFRNQNVKPFPSGHLNGEEGSRKYILGKSVARFTLFAVYNLRLATKNGHQYHVVLMVSAG